MNCHACPRTDTRFYANGYCCPDHTPAAIEGRPEVTIDPELTAEALFARAGHGPALLNDSSLIDDRAKASGRRRSSARDYRAARLAEQKRRQVERLRRTGKAL